MVSHKVVPWNGQSAEVVANSGNRGNLHSCSGGFNYRKRGERTTGPQITSPSNVGGGAPSFARQECVEQPPRAAHRIRRLCLYRTLALASKRKMFREPFGEQQLTKWLCGN